MTQDGNNKKTPEPGTFKNGVADNQFRGGRGRGNRGRGNRGRGNGRSWKTGRSRGGGNQPRVDREKDKEKGVSNGTVPAGPKANSNVQKRAPQENNKYGKNKRSGGRGGHHSKRGKDTRHKQFKDGPSEESSGSRQEAQHPFQRRQPPKNTKNIKHADKEKEKEKQKPLSPHLKSVISMRSRSWADDEATPLPTNDVQSLEREKPVEGNQVSAASRAIARLQIKVGELEQEKRALTGKVQRLEQANAGEKNAHTQTRAKLETLQQKFNILERVNANFENLRTRLENERESLRKQLFHSKTRATTALGSIDYATELKRKENALESSNKEISALKADIEYHQAQHDYMQIRLENMEAENSELKKKVSDFLSTEKQTKAGILAKDSHPQELQRSMRIDDEEKEVDTTSSSNKTLLASKLRRFLLDGPLLLSTKEPYRFDVISALDFRNDQVHLLDISKWDREDAFLFEIYQIFLSYRFKGVEALANAQEFSSVVWRAIYEGLCQLCTKEILVFINCIVQTPQADHAGSVQLPSGLTSSQESTLRFFFSCLAAAYESVETPEKVVIVLEGWTRDRLKGEDLSGQGEYKQFHVVRPFHTLVL